jgi:hypothetical protein
MNSLIPAASPEITTSVPKLSGILWTSVIRLPGKPGPLSLNVVPEFSLKIFPPCYSQSPLKLCLEISVSSNSRNLLQFLQFSYLHCNGQRRKPDRKPYPLPYGLRNPYRNLKFENSPGYAQKVQQNCIFMNSAFDLLILSCLWDPVLRLPKGCP